MTTAYVELSGESLPLAHAELRSAAEALGGRAVESDLPRLAAVELFDEGAVTALAARLGLARRCLERVGAATSFDDAVAAEAAEGAPAAFRPLGHSAGATGASVLRAGRTYRAAGGTIDLERPARRYWIAVGPGDDDVLLREVGTVDRRGAGARRMPQLPFQRPVSLPPRLARAAANLARIRPGDRVADPFVGTAALLAEAALLGARTIGVDRDPAMIQGSLRNFAHLGLTAERLIEGDAGVVIDGETSLEVDAVLTDPPYGRSSSTGGERAEAVVERVVPRWAEHVRPGGRCVVVAPSGARALPPPWELVVCVPVRVHRSLTREFRAYERPD